MNMKIIYFFLLFLTIVGMLGGIGYAFYNDAYIVGIGLIISIYSIIPGVRNLYNKLIA